MFILHCTHVLTSKHTQKQLSMLLVVTTLAHPIRPGDGLSMEAGQIRELVQPFRCTGALPALISFYVSKGYSLLNESHKSAEKTLAFFFVFAYLRLGGSLF